METTLKFDRVILKKEMNSKFKKVGETYEIANISDNSFLLRDASTRVAVGIVSFEDFEEYFTHEENFKGWTPWTPLTGFDGQTDAYYRTNKRKTQVKFLTNNVRAESCCSKDDDFNLAFGIQMAYLRCLNKAMRHKMSKYATEIKKMNSEIADNEGIMKRMINSLEV